MPDNTPLNGAAPALGNPAQFTAEYWTHVPRQTLAVVIHKVRDLPQTGEKEFFAKTGTGDQMRFRRKAHEITQLVMPGTPANIELIQNELITGMYLPDVRAWVFHMSAQDLADYTKEISGHLHEQRLKARELMLDAVTEAILVALMELELVVDPGSVESPHPAFAEPNPATEDSVRMARHLALVAIGALESGPQQGGV